jgi:hypothetical protein
MNKENERLPGLRWLSWILRILLIIIALYIEKYSFDVLKFGFSFWKTVLAFIIHSVPFIMLILIFLVALKWEHIAGFTLICFALMGTLPAGTPNDKNEFLYFILGATAIIGILFVINYFFLGNRKTGDLI